MPKEDSPDALIPLLNNKFRATAVKLPAGTQEDYDMLRNALLERDEANIQDAASMFWNYTKKAGVSGLEERQLILRLIPRFIDREDKDSWMDALARERITQGLPKEGRLFVRERKPKTSMEATKLVEQFFAIREESYTAWKASPRDQEQQTVSGKRDRPPYGRERYDNYRGRRERSPKSSRDRSPKSEDREEPPKSPSCKQLDQGDRKSQRPRRDPRSGKCFACGEEGHR